MSAEQNKALLRRLMEEVFNRGNISLIDELFAHDFVEHEELPPVYRLVVRASNR